MVSQWLLREAWKPARASTESLQKNWLSYTIDLFIFKIRELVEVMFPACCWHGSSTFNFKSTNLHSFYRSCCVVIVIINFDWILFISNPSQGLLSLKYCLIISAVPSKAAFCIRVMLLLVFILMVLKSLGLHPWPLWLVCFSCFLVPQVFHFYVFIFGYFQQFFFQLCYHQVLQCLLSKLS